MPSGICELLLSLINVWVFFQRRLLFIGYLGVILLSLLGPKPLFGVKHECGLT